jgi:hypothetical protein
LKDKIESGSVDLILTDLLMEIRNTAYEEN